MATTFSLQTNEAYKIKVLAELLKQSLIEFNIVLTPSTISIRESDQNEKIIIDVSLRAEEFVYQPPSTPLTIGMTSAHLHQALKRIKQKDKVSLFIYENDPESLHSKIVNTEKDRNKTAALKLKEVPVSIWSLPEYPIAPVTLISTGEFQKTIKDMITLSPTIEISIQARGVKISSILESLAFHSDIYGEYDEDIDPIYRENFDARVLSKLAKMTGICSHFKVFHSPDNSILQFCCSIEKLGYFRAYLLPNPVV